MEEEVRKEKEIKDLRLKKIRIMIKSKKMNKSNVRALVWYITSPTSQL